MFSAAAPQPSSALLSPLWQLSSPPPSSPPLLSSFLPVLLPPFTILPLLPISLTRHILLSSSVVFLFYLHITLLRLFAALLWVLLNTFPSQPSSWISSLFVSLQLPSLLPFLSCPSDYFVSLLPAANFLDPGPLLLLSLAPSPWRCLALPEQRFFFSFFFFLLLPSFPFSLTYPLLVAVMPAHAPSLPVSHSVSLSSSHVCGLLLCAHLMAGV